jgi:hypothetical protein
VREEIHHVREGKHGARSTKQAIAIGLSKARRAGVKLPKPRKASARTKQSAEYATRAGRRGSRKTSPRRARAVRGALKREGTRAASRSALSRQATNAARRRSPAARAQRLARRHARKARRPDAPPPSVQHARGSAKRRAGAVRLPEFAW